MAAVCAGDVMSAPVISIKAGTTLQEAVKVLAENNISGAPVVNEEGELIGIITEKDIVEYASELQVIPLIGSKGWVSPQTDVTEIASFKKGFETLGSTSVEKAMSEKVITVKEDTPGPEVARLMKKKKVNRVPVVDEQGRLCGIITRANLVHYLAEREG